MCSAAIMLLIALEGGAPIDLSVSGPAWDGESFRVHVDGPSRISFETPLSGFLVEARHFDADLPVEKVKHLLTLAGPGGPEVTVDVWVALEPVELSKFFDTYLDFLRQADTSVVSVAVTPRRVAGLLLSQPRSGQSFGHLSAVFAIGARVFRITCLDKDDARARTVFEHVLESFEAEAR